MKRQKYKKNGIVRVFFVFLRFFLVMSWAPFPQKPPRRIFFDRVFKTTLHIPSCLRESVAVDVRIPTALNATGRSTMLNQ